MTEAGKPFRHLRRELAGYVAPAPHRPDLAIRCFDASRDAGQVHALIGATYRDAGDDFPAIQEWRNWLMSDDEYAANCIFLAFEEGRLCGVALCWTSGFIKDLAVTPSYRRRGVGRALMLHVFDHFAGAGHEAVELKVKLANTTGAERLYRSLGMVDVEA